MQNRRMTGRFIVLPFEVIDKLSELPEACTKIYHFILKDQIIQEKWDVPGDWVIGTFKATKTELIGKRHRHYFYTKWWPALIKAGLINESTDGKINLPMYKKKIDLTLNPAQIQELIQKVEKLEEIISEMNPDNGLQDINSGSRNLQHGSQIDPDPDRDAIQNRIASRSGHIYIDQKDKDKDQIDDDDEARDPVYCDGGEKMQRAWIVNRILELWPGTKKLLKQDDDYVSQLRKFSKDALDEAFSAATVERVNRRNYDWILNRLENPEHFVKKKKSSGRKSRKKKDSVKFADPDIGVLNSDCLGDEPEIGVLNADWLEDDEVGPRGRGKG